MASSRPQKTIQSLPPEILMKIFCYLPKFVKDKISLTSKAFNEIICEMKKFKCPLVITAETVIESHSIIKDSKYFWPLLNLKIQRKLLQHPVQFFFKHPVTIFFQTFIQ
jgi:hypothetical protein